MSLTKKIVKYALPILVATTIATGCATTKKPSYDSNRLPTVSFVNPNRKLIDARLRALAGIINGSVEVKKIRDGYSAKGFYSEAQNPEAMKKAKRISDLNKDGVITAPEVKKVLNLAYRLYAK